LSGIPILTTLTDVEVQVSTKRFRKIIAEIRDSMTQDGKSLSESLAEHPKAFPEVYIVTIEAGELTGQLDYALQQLVEFLEWRHEIRLQLRQTSIYPGIILMVLAGLLVVLTTFVYPRLLPVFQSFDTELPLPTRIVMGLGSFVTAYWMHMIGAVVGVIVLFRVVYRTERGRLLIDSARLKVPIFGKLLHQIEMARLVTHLSLFFRTGIDLLRGLDLLERLSTNRRISRAVRRSREAVIQGESLTRAFSETGLFPPIVLRGLALGEATGKLDETLDRARAYYAREVPAAVKAMLAALQPLLIVVVGATILFVALSIFMPILNIYEGIGQ
jgi:type II secretory pathway component PulF